LKIIVKPHRIIINNDKLVNEREVNVSKCYFEFDKEITDDFVKEAYFTFKGNTYKQLIQNNECSFPQEVLTDKGQIEIGVVAYKIDNELIRYNPRPAYFNTLLGSLKDDVENSEPITPTDKEQILSELANKQDTLVSGVNIKTINHESLLGEGNINITGGSGGTSDYEDLDNKPSINNIELSGNKSLNDLGIQPSGNYALESDIPTKISDLTDDSDFLESTDLKTINGNSIVGSGDITISGGSSFGLHTEKYDTLGSKNVTHTYMYDEYYGTNADFVAHGLDFLEKVYNDMVKYFDTTAARNFIKIVGNDGDGTFNVSIELSNMVSTGTVYGNFWNYSQYRSIRKQIKFNVSLENNVYKISGLQNSNSPIAISLTTYNDITYTPTASTHPATKGYVDDAIASAITTTLGGSY